MIEPADDGGRLRGLAAPDAEVRVVHGSQSRVERYRVILPRQDAAAWHMVEVQAPEARRELVSPELRGSLGIHLSVVTLAPGIRDQPHCHVQGGWRDLRLTWIEPCPFIGPPSVG